MIRTKTIVCLFVDPSLACLCMLTTVWADWWSIKCCKQSTKSQIRYAAPHFEMTHSLARHADSCSCFFSYPVSCLPQEVLLTWHAERSLVTAETSVHLSTGWRGISLLRILMRSAFKKVKSSKIINSWSKVSWLRLWILCFLLSLEGFCDMLPNYNAE